LGGDALPLLLQVLHEPRHVPLVGLAHDGVHIVAVGQPRVHGVLVAGVVVGYLPGVSEIWLEVVDQRFLEARGVPSHEGKRKIRRANAGGKDTPRYVHTTPRSSSP
jgi:hypothetical protein